MGEFPALPRPHYPAVGVPLRHDPQSSKMLGQSRIIDRPNAIPARRMACRADRDFPFAERCPVIPVWFKLKIVPAQEAREHESWLASGSRRPPDRQVTVPVVLKTFFRYHIARFGIKRAKDNVKSSNPCGCCSALWRGPGRLSGTKAASPVPPTHRDCGRGSWRLLWRALA